MPRAALLAIAAMAAAWLLLRPRPVVAADGRRFVRLAAAGRPNDAGIASSSVWRTDPDDGHRYTPDLAYELGGTDAPMFSRFV